MFKRLLTLLRVELAELKAFISVDGNHVYVYRWILYHQGFWPALERNNVTPPSRFRYWNPRLTLATWTYQTVIGFPMTVDGGALFDLAEPLVFLFIFSVGVAISFSLLYRSHLFQEAVEAFDDMIECSRRLPKQSHGNLGLRKKTCSAFFSLALGMAFVILVTTVSALPFLIPTRSFMVRIWYPYNATVWPCYVMTQVGWSAWTVSGVAFVGSTLALLVTLMLQAWSHLELLCLNLAVLGDSGLLRTSQTYPMAFGTGHDGVNDEMAQVLRICVIHHQALMRFVTTVGQAFNLMLSQLLVAFLIPSGLFIFSMQHLDRINFTTGAQILALLCVAVTLLLAFFIGDKISQQSELVRESAFACDWLQAPESLKRSLRIVMSRSNQPLVITVAGGIPLSLETGRQLFYLTYEYYTFMVDRMSSSATNSNSNSNPAQILANPTPP